MAPLANEQLSNLKNKLTERHAELRNEIREELLRSDEEHYIDLAGNVHDTGEESVADMLADLNIAMVNRQVREIKQIEAAQVRMATGNYGVCIDCGDDIDIARLQNTPSTERCTNCQSLHEKTYAHENTPTL